MADATQSALATPDWAQDSAPPPTSSAVPDWAQDEAAAVPPAPQSALVVPDWAREPATTTTAPIPAAPATVQPSAPQATSARMGQAVKDAGASPSELPTVVIQPGPARTWMDVHEGRGETPSQPVPSAAAAPSKTPTWSDVARAVPTEIGAKIETIGAGYQERGGASEYADARKKFWQSMILPRAVRESRDLGIALIDHPDVQDEAKRLGIRVDVFARDWPKYANMSDDELGKFQSEQRARIESGQAQELKGEKRRETVAQVRQEYEPQGLGTFSPKGLAFNVVTMAPELLGGTAASMVGGAPLAVGTLFADAAPQTYAAARNAGASDQTAANYAVLSGIAQSVPEVPVFKVIGDTGAGRAILETAVGRTLAKTTAGKIAGTAVTQGVTQATIQALQTGIDAGIIDQHTSLSTALERIGQAGIIGAVTGAPLGAMHAAMHPEPKEGRPPTPAPAERGVEPDAATPVPEAATEPLRGATEGAIPATQGPETETETPPTLQDRLKSDHALRNGLQAMKGETGWAEVGGRIIRHPETGEVTGRTKWIPNAEWWRDRPRGMTEEEVHNAVDKALAGEDLTKKQQRMVQFMADVHDERQARAATHGELAEAVPDLGRQPPGAADLTVLASRAHEVDPEAAVRTMDSWNDDEPATLARVQGELERIIGRGREEDIQAQAARPGQPEGAESPPSEAGRFWSALERARSDTDTAPSREQIEAGNYAKGELRFAPGLTFTMENPRGSTRSGTDADGKRWYSQLAHDYGYINRTEGADGDHVDAFLTGKPDTGKVFVVNQVDPKTGKFDEHKAVLGASTPEEARETYLANYPRGWKGLGSIAEMPTGQFRDWLENGDTTKPAPAEGERRLNTARRQAVANMSADELRRELLTHELTGIPNRRAYRESEKLPVQVSVDANSLKFVNDTGGHEAGDHLLKAIATALHDETEHAYHFGGDEFVVQAQTPEEAEGIIARAKSRLGKANVELRAPSGRKLTLKGIGIAHGTGRTLEEADRALQQEKARQERTGERAPRGEAPPGATLELPEGRVPGRAGHAAGAVEHAQVEEGKTSYSATHVPAGVGEDFQLAPPPKAPEGEAPAKAVRAPPRRRAGQLDLFTAKDVRPERMARALARTGLHEVGRFATGVTKVRLWLDAAHILAPLRRNPQEAMAALVTDAEGKPIAVLRHSVGQTAAASVQVHSLVGAAAQIPGGRHIWFAHNHPSGGASQSIPDNRMTEALHEVLRGTGLEPEGMLVLAPGSREVTFHHPALHAEGQEETERFEPHARRASHVPVVERHFSKVLKQGEGITSPSRAVAAIKASGEKGGMLLLDTRGGYRGVVPLTQAEMGRLRVGDPAGGAVHVLREIAGAGADTAITFGPEAWSRELENLGSLLEQSGVSIRDNVQLGAGGEYRSAAETNKPTSSGGPYFRRGASGAMPVAHVERIVREAVRGGHFEGGRGFPHVEVHEDTSTLPAHIQDVIARDEAERTTGAVYDPASDTIHLVAANNGSEQEVRENLWHEAVGHHGLRLIMDSHRYAEVMDGIFRDMPERVRAAAVRNGLDVSDLRQRRAAAEEVIAYAAGRILTGLSIEKPMLPVWHQALRAIRAFFSRMFGRPFYDEHEIASLVAESAKAVKFANYRTRLSTMEEARRSQRAAAWYSPVERAVANSKQSRASAEQWLATIRKTPGVKADELAWSGVEHWLSEQKGPVTKEALQDYLRANRLELEETTYGGMGEHGAATPDEAERDRIASDLRARGYELVFEDGVLESVGTPVEGAPTGMEPTFLHDAEDLEALPADIREKVERLGHLSDRITAQRFAQSQVSSEETPGATRYGEYTLPGGENYRELLLKLPDRPFAPADLDARKEVFDRYQKAIDNVDSRMDDLIRGGNRPFDWQDELLRLRHQRELLEAQRDAEAERVGPEAPVFTHGHWPGERNVLAHVRFNDRTDASGKKTLFLEEVQSDWHQRGRQRGYAKDENGRPPLPEGWIVRAPDAQHSLWRMLADNGDERSWQFRARTEGDLWAEADSHLRRVAGQGYTAVPDAPFKTSWPMLAMKRVIRFAAEHGYDRIAWTTGDQQNERYNLAHNGITKVGAERFVDPQGNRKYFLRARFEEGGEVPGLGEAIPEGDLADAVGQHLAERIKSQPEGHHEYSGEDFKVGGAGMRGFYDKILPTETGKLIKRWGGKVEDSTVSGPLTWDDANGNFSGELHAEQFPAHGFDVTPTMRQAALGEGFPLFARREAARQGGIAGARPAVRSEPLDLGEPPEVGTGAYERIRRAVDYLVHENPIVRDIRKVVAPVGLSRESVETARLATKAFGQLAADTHQVREQLEQFARVVERLPVEDQLSMIDAIENGQAQPHPELQPVADAMRKTLDHWRDEVQRLGNGYLENFIENYFPHYWADEAKAKRLMASVMGRRPLRGPASFLKRRTIATIKEGMDAGLVPLTTNPLTMTLLKTREMQRFVAGVNLMRTLKANGLAEFLRAGRPMPEGWASINDASARVRQWSELEQGFIERGQYVMPEDAARVINNHVSGSALQKFAPAQLFRIGANALSALQLGFSGFHLGFTTLDAVISKNALALERLVHGEPLKAAAAFGEAATGPLAAALNIRRGHQLMEAYANPAKATPQLQKVVKALIAAGGRASMDRYYLPSGGESPFRGAGIHSLASDLGDALTGPDKAAATARAIGTWSREYPVKLWRTLQEIGRTYPAIAVPLEVAGRVTRASTAWIMEHVVPLQKLGVFSDLAHDYLRRNPTAGPDELARAMQSAWASVDNRLGEMVYDNLFWNRTWKDAMHLAVRAVGWNLGTIREIAGAPVDAIGAVDKLVRTGKVTADDLGHKIPYVLAMTLTTAMVGASLQYLLTGQGPQELKDYFFPRTGGVDHYGNPERVSLPSYVKDIYEYSQRPGKTIANKLNPIWSTTADIYENEDYFGRPISDPDANAVEQAWQRAQFVGREAMPFSLQGARQIAGSEGAGFGAEAQRALPYVGLSPAPGYITSPDQIAHRERYEQEQAYTRETYQELRKALQEGDQAAIAEYRDRWIAAKQREAATRVEIMKDRARSAAGRRQISQNLRSDGKPATAALVDSLPLTLDSDARTALARFAAGEGAQASAANAGAARAAG